MRSIPLRALHLGPLSIVACTALAGCTGETTATGVEALQRSFAERADDVLQGAGPIETSGDGFALRAPSTASPRARLDVDWPSDGAGAIRMRLGDGFEVVVHEIGAYGAGARVERAVSYQRAGGTSFWTAAPNGAEEWLLLDAASARGDRAAAAWEIGGATPRLRGSVVELVDASGKPRLRMTAPRAYAAGDRPIEARLAVRGSTIEISVDGGGDAVLVDPIWTSVSSMIEGRARHIAGLLPTGEVLVAGGYGTAWQMSSAERYDPSADAWAPATSMNVPRDIAAATTLADGRVMVVGGYDGTGMQSSAEVYDAATDTWTLTSPMSTPRYRHSVTRLADGRVLVAGGDVGYPDFFSLASAETYDPATDTWAPAASMNVPRQAHAAALLPDGRVLVVGSDDLAVTSAEIYDPAADTWTLTGSLGDAVAWTFAAALPNGDVLLTGGDDNATSVFTASRWNAATGTWSAAPPMAAHRDRHTMTLLPSGKMLVAGGCGYTFTANAEVYDASTSAWSCAGTMTAGRCEHTATLLQDGRVLVAGGASDTGVPGTAEIFDPEDPTWCVPTDDCGGGYFVDGVCCDSACPGPCMACSMAKGATADGVCTLLDAVPCDDGNMCTQGDVCQAGTCASSMWNDFCDPPTSECQGTFGICDPMMGCYYDQPDGTACTGGTCISGNCVPASSSDDDDDDDASHGHGHGHGPHGHGQVHHAH